ncbi:hypothetical protein O0L34_g12263 [Tuta absoluta]|nr:hypothetical protein O0L34_g12263 [Tuta absoluta]
MADSYAEGLRQSAPQWSLAGDKQLLDVLQGLHQKIIEKCQETNINLEHMVSALDEASIHLQNVNNKFTALSNSQFIESRVYDDDNEDINEHEKPKIEPEQKPDEMASIKRSLEILENLHESVTILCDSDSDSGTDDDEDITRVVLKPKDLYADRPLPYIIGSKPWKAKWHAGLVPDDSDSVSSGSMKHVDRLEQYSDSDEPRSDSPQHSPRHSPQLSLSSEIDSEQLPQSISTPKPTALPRDPRSQSDVAAELARRLGAAEHKLPVPEPIPEVPSPTVRKLYKPEKPTPGTVFLDEPPPLGSDQSDESDGDIFAELHKKQPYAYGNKVESSVADDLFGRPVFAETPPPVNPPAKQKQTLFQDESEPELFAVKPKPAPEPRKEEDIGIKKPIGGKSLFGSNATAESIGAAILKRNQRQSSTSGEESEQEPPQTINKINKPTNKVIDEEILDRQKDDEVKSQKEKERDIFDDLFAKSEKINKEKNKNKVVEQKKEQPKPVKKPDLFSDNIFDDIDDIFTTNIKVVTKEQKKAQKSIFDDDDLFSDVSKNVNNNQIKKIKTKNTKDIFDDKHDVDIFSDKPKEVKKESKERSIKETKSIFDDSDDDLFAEVDTTKTTKNVTMSVNVTKNETVTNLLSSSEKKTSDKGLFSEDEDLFKNDNSANESHNIKQKSPTVTTYENKLNVDTSKKEPSKIIKSPDLFEDDDDDGLFLFQSQNKPVSKDSAVNKPKDGTAKISREMTPDTKHKISEETSDIEPASSIFGDEDTANDLFVKPVKTNKDESSTFTDSEESNISKPNIVGALDSFKDDNNIASNNKTFDTIVTESKPNISAKPDIANITVINSQITKKITTESLSPQDLPANNSTVIDTHVTIIPEITKETVKSADINVDEPKVTGKPYISRKPIISNSKSESEENVTKNANASNVLDNIKEVNAHENVTDSIFEDFKTVKETTIKTKDAFSDVFNDQPPIFEKLKEPKRSKNVNALFDDDSDDESLFFKKNDVISDERPEGFVSTDDRLFGLFRDEPPAIDVDFVQKPKKLERQPKENLRQNIHSDTSSQQVDQNINKTDKIEEKSSLPNKEDMFGTKNQVTQNILESDDVFASSSNNDKPVSAANVKDTNKYSNNDDMFSNDTDDIFKNVSTEDDIDIFGSPAIEEVQKQQNSEVKTEPIPDKEITVPENTDKDNIEPKKIGKLKSINLNINVNSLLPGASPKKTVKSSDKIDGHAPSKSTDELSSSEAVKENAFETKIVKSVSFDGNPGSPVLNNKFSKERAKIQVKRRPSTRRARREAVKKSGLDFGEDSTDNSSSIDDHVKSKNETQSVQKNITSTEQEKSASHHVEEIVTKDANTNVKDGLETISHQEQTKDNPENNVIESHKVSCNLEDVTHITANEASIENETSKTFVKPDVTTNSNPLKDVKSKIVYILNDEDIFDSKDKISDITNPPVPTETLKTGSIFDDPDDPDDLFTPKVSKAPEIANQNPADSRSAKTGGVFDDSDDLFKATVRKTSETVKSNRAAAVTMKPESIFNDTDELSVKDSKLPELSVKTESVFDDSDDIFAAKATKIPDIVKPTLADTENIKNKSAFNDKDDIFHAKVNKIPDIASQVPTENAKTRSASDDPDDIFKSITENENTKVEIKTLGQVYNEPIAKTQKLDFFSDSDDDNLFKTSKTTKVDNSVQKQVKTDEKVNVVVKDVPLKSKSKSSLFDDTSEDLFKGKTKEIIKTEKKVSLFSSDSDEELFGGSNKDKAIAKKDEFQKEVKREIKKGSLFEDDDDDDLFGANSKKKIDAKPQPSKPTATKEVISKPTEPVFEDPLSLLGSDDE